MLDIAFFGLATACGAGLRAVEAARRGGLLPLSAAGDFFGNDYKPLLRAFAPDAGIDRAETRIHALIGVALRDLRQQLLAAGISWPRCALVVLTPAAGPGFDPERAETLSAGTAASLQGAGWCDPARGVVAIQAQAAGTAPALARAAELCRHGPVLLVAADSFACRDRLNALLARRALFDEQNKWGFIPGEAAVAALCTAPGQLRQAAARLHAVALTQEPVPESANADSAFTGLSEAAHAALDATGAGVGVGRVVSDWNNSRYRASELSYALLRVGSRLTDADPEPVYPALEFGHTGAAWIGPVLAGPALSGRAALVLCGSDGGVDRAAFTLGPREPA